MIALKKMAKVKFNCTNCNKKLEKFKSEIPKSGKGYCSASCSTSYRNKYEYNPSHTRDLAGCNNPMFGKGELISGSKNGMYGRTGNSSPSFKGGRHIRKDGYIRVLINGKRILEHRKVLMDEDIDLEGKIVHHKDNDKSNNELSNLVVMTQSEHINEHRESLLLGRK